MKVDLTKPRNFAFTSCKKPEDLLEFITKSLDDAEKMGYTEAEIDYRIENGYNIALIVATAKRE